MHFSIPPRKPPTLGDVAELAGVSRTIASRVLNNRPTPFPLRQETIDRIITAAAELGYQPELTHRGRRQERSYVLNMLACDVSDPFNAKVIQAFSRSAKKFGYRVLLSDVGNDPSEEEYFLQLFSDHVSDGVLILRDSPQSERLSSTIPDKVRHVVGFAQSEPLPGIVSIGLDDAYGAELALEYLYGLGHERIAHIAHERYADLRQRTETYRRYLATRGLALPEGYIQLAPQDSLVAGTQATFALLDLPQPPTAIFAATDRLALGALRAALERGVRVPKELSVVGYDDIGFTEAAWPPLTTVHYPVQEMADKAAEVLVGMVEGRRRPDAPLRYTFRPTLAVRSSCTTYKPYGP